MKRSLLCLALFGIAAVLGGCPIYSNQSDYRVCNGSGCFDCPDPTYSSMCVPWSCSTDSDCGGSYSCSFGQCVAPGSQQPGSMQPDCSVSGCPVGEVCRLAGGVASCVVVAPAAGDDGGGPVADATAVQDAVSDALLALDAPPEGQAFDASHVSDSGEAASDAPLADSSAPVDGSPAIDATPPVSCNADGDCALGSKCIDGQCTRQSELCSDGSQCAVSGDSCVNGICVPHCSASSPCPSGYACDFGRGVCDINPGPCTGSGTSSCLGGAVCVESHCVPPCGVAEGGAACASGQICVNDGCIPEQKALFSCRNDGASGQLANACDSTSVCLHHDCYVACDGDGGGCAPSACKQVTVTAGTYAVCATATSLGSDCDLATGAACQGTGVCIDGYCR